MLAGLVSFLGVGLCGLLSGILGSGFIEVMCEESERKERRAERLRIQVEKDLQIAAEREEEEFKAGLPVSLRTSTVGSSGMPDMLVLPQEGGQTPWKGKMWGE